MALCVPCLFLAALAAVPLGLAAAQPPSSAQPRAAGSRAPFGMDTDTRLQIALERRMFSVNCIDGTWGVKSDAALRAWCSANGVAVPAARAEALRLLDDGTPPYVLHRITSEEAASLVKIPADPPARARLEWMGYETLLEMLAERGHTSRRAMMRLNPHAAWPDPPPGTVVRLPNMATTNALPKAALVKVRLSCFDVSVYGADGRMVALFPCSIAAEKSKLPPPGEIRVKGIAPHPNYTYTAPPDPSGKRRKYIYPAGPNNPVGSAWVGLSLPSYGIHGTPGPETIGRAESHGCFRLANWNAERLRDMVPEGCRVVIE